MELLLQAVLFMFVVCDNFYHINSIELCHLLMMVINNNYYY